MHSYSELSASPAILASHDNDHVIYIFIWDLEKGAQPDLWNIKLIWYGLTMDIIPYRQGKIRWAKCSQYQPH